MMERFWKAVRSGEIQGGWCDESFYLVHITDRVKDGFAARVDEADRVEIYAFHPIETEGWKAKVSLCPTRSYSERDADGEPVTYYYGPYRLAVWAEGPDVAEHGASIVSVGGIKFTNGYDNAPEVGARIWFQLCKLAGVEPFVFHLPNAYAYWADVDTIRDDRFVPIRRYIVQKDGVPSYELVLDHESELIGRKPVHRTFVFQDGTKVQLFVNVASWLWPRVCSQRGQTWIESWEQRHAWRVEAMVSCWRGEKPSVLIPDKDGREWFVFYDKWALASEPELLWRELLDAVDWLHNLPVDRIQLVLEDGTQVPVLQEIPGEPAWDRPPAHDVSYEQVDREGIPTIPLNRVW